MTPTTHEPCLFEEGDRIDHQVFGLGTVNDAPSKAFNFSGPAGWNIPVEWDDQPKGPLWVADWSLTKMTSPTAHPFTYWNRRWQPLLQGWTTARQRVEANISTFRPLPDLAHLRAARQEEEEAWQVLLRFLDDEAAGWH